MRPQTVTDEEILAVSRKIFLENGPQVSVDKIAKELGLSQPALFKRFGTKRALMVKSIQSPKEIRWFSIADREPDERPFKDQLKDLVNEISLFLKTVQPVIQFIHTTDISPMELFENHEEPPPVKGLRKLTLWLKRCCEKDLIAEVNFRQAAITIMGSIQFNSFTKIFIGEEGSGFDFKENEKFINDFTEFLWNGFKKR